MSSSAELIISFINVGDGDAILIRETDPGFTMLIDTGRGDVNEVPNSLSLTCADYLRGLGVKHIDVLLITHLHEDHQGGLRAVMENTVIDAVYSAYFPAVSGLCRNEPNSVKTVRGLIECLNKWAGDVQALKAKGARLISVDKTTRLALTDGLTAEIIVRNETSLKEQHAVYDGMFSGMELTQEQKFDASKLRNPNSLRTRLYFAGRVIELAADCYGCLWENEAVKCDIFKVPHHGDCKAITAKLAKTLCPRDAVISCSNIYFPEKDRPSRETARFLREAGSRVWYTDSFSDGGEPAVKRRSLDFVISADGLINERKKNVITTVLFDMGGTLEDIWVDGESEKNSIVELEKMLIRFGLLKETDSYPIKERVDAGWVKYGKLRDRTNVELKPVEIWCDYALAEFNFPREKLAPHCEEIAHMWEVTHFHRKLRQGAREMLAELSDMGLKLGVISNTASLYQVFDTLEEYEIRDFFKNVTLSSVTGLRKPCVDIFTVSLRQMRSEAKQCVYVGDTISRDVIGPRRAGFAAAVQIGSKLTREKDQDVSPDEKPDYFIEKIGDVTGVIRAMMGL